MTYRYCLMFELDDECKIIKKTISDKNMFLASILLGSTERLQLRTCFFNQQQLLNNLALIACRDVLYPYWDHISTWWSLLLWKIWFWNWCSTFDNKAV